ncbi:MAG: phosphoadenosine phosphosulfate reductase family protein, partial [Armatimonadota bacterium]
MQGLIGEPLMARPADYVLWRSGRDYFAAGRKVFRLSGGNYAEPPQLQVLDADLMQLLRGRRKGRRPNWLRRDPGETRALLGDANIVRLVRLEEEAISFLQDVRREYADLPLVVSWSGGKDSTVASVLAQRAFPDERIPHVFADTTIELPSTYEFLREFRRANPAIPFLVGIPARDFFELCREIGPPSRIQRWCCTTHKAAPLTDVLRAVGGNRQVLVVGGLRRTESIRRQRYQRVIDSGKIGLQVLLSPLADWTDFDVWAWTAVSGQPLNGAYKFGMDRVGCAFCPDSRDWSDMVASAAFVNYFAPWLSLLAELAAQAGVDRADLYAAEGVWKNRRGGRIGSLGLPEAGRYDIVTTPCHSDDASTTYELFGEFDLRNLAELLKPFGHVSLETADHIGQLQVAGPHGAFAVRAIPHWRRVRVTFESDSMRRRLEGTVRLQLRKLQACVGCGACAAICP